MGLHAYCIATVTPGAPNVTTRGAQGGEVIVSGIDGAAVRAITENGLSMWCSEHAAPPVASIDAIRHHNDVVVAAMTDTRSPIPLRFGQWLRDDDAVIAALQTSHEKWAVMAHRFEGAVEFGIRVFDPARESEGASATAAAAVGGAKEGAGRAYMDALAARLRGPDQARTAVLAALRDAMREVVMEERTEPLKTAHGVVSVAYLLHRGRSDAFREAVDVVQLSMPRLRLLSTGPWPPYSFVE